VADAHLRGLVSGRGRGGCAAVRRLSLRRVGAFDVDAPAASGVAGKEASRGGGGWAAVVLPGGKTPLGWPLGG
jgi:hypothetical protein